ncbi:MAG: hypothetical protein HY718_13660 [Planctomycetes bacterium]|nr:hypothetical protein [Planctomycetota bacterium]
MSLLRISVVDRADPTRILWHGIGRGAVSGPTETGLIEPGVRGAHIRRNAWLFTAFLMVSGGCGDDSKDTGSTTFVGPVLKVETDTFTSAEVCGACHQAIHACWQQSMHARAFSNGVFQAAYRAGTAVYQSERTRMCLNCHAPTVHVTQDYAAESPITREGVTCDFCHSLRSVDLGAPQQKMDLDVGQTKYGPLKHAQSPAHRVRNSGLHSSSELCAVCHEYRNDHGVAILETYSEWKTSPYAEEGTHCQACHMVPVQGRIVSLGLTAAAREGVNLHDISGSHDLEQVRKAATIEVLSVERLGQSNVLVQISVNNVGAGHCLPTGLPSHRVVLEVNLMDRGRVVAQQRIEFAKVLLNDRMIPIAFEEEMFLEARSIKIDTRLKPKEKRTVSVTFRDIQSPEGQIGASLFYEYSTRTMKLREDKEVSEPTVMKILIASQKRAVPGTGR